MVEPVFFVPKHSIEYIRLHNLAYMGIEPGEEIEAAYPDDVATAREYSQLSSALEALQENGVEPSAEILEKLEPEDVESARKTFKRLNALRALRGKGIEPDEEALALLDPSEIEFARESWQELQASRAAAEKPLSAAERLEKEFGIVIATQYDMARKEMRSGFYTTRRISSDGSDDGFRQAVSKTTLTPYPFNGTAEELLAELLARA
jgi:hypothetical protein